jgi:ferredoxin
MHTTRNYIQLQTDECKGCRLCIAACPTHSLSLSADINRLGYPYVLFRGSHCTACGLCYYVCPEPGVITVYKEKKAEGTVS